MDGALLCLAGTCTAVCASKSPPLLGVGRAAGRLNLSVLIDALWLVPISFTVSGQELGKRVRVLFEKIGGVFPKLGQALSERPDLIRSKDIRDELKQLQHQCQSMSEEDLKTAFKNPELQFMQKWHDLKKEPFAAASIGQLHVLDKFFVMKLVNIDQERKIRAQEELVTALSDAKFNGRAGLMTRTLQAVFGTVVAEFDLTTEANNTIFARQMIAAMKRQAVWFRDQVKLGPMDFLQRLKVPQVYKHNSKFMVMENIMQGERSFVTEKLNDFLARPEISQSIKENVLAVVLEAWGRMILLAGCFHCDPHGGNLYVKYRILRPKNASQEGRTVNIEAIWLIDWGSVCTLSPQQVQLLRFLVSADVLDPSMLETMGIHFPSKYRAEDKLKFARGLFSTAWHCYIIKHNLSDPAVPDELPAWIVQLLRVLSTFGAYAALVEDGCSTDPWFHTDKLWKAILKTDRLYQSMISRLGLVNPCPYPDAALPVK